MKRLSLPMASLPAWKIAVFLVIVGVITLFLGGVTMAHVENNDAFCASCHTEPEATYYAREGADAVDLASVHAEKGVNCIDCHSGPGWRGRVSAMMLGARDAFHYLSGQYPQPAPLTRPITDEHCLKCHADVLQGRDFNNHFHILLPRWQVVDPNAAHCVDCHQGHETNGDPKLQFLNKATTVAVCQACHRVAGEGD